MAIHSTEVRKLYSYERSVPLKTVVELVKQLFSEVSYKKNDKLYTIRPFLNELNHRIEARLKNYHVIVPLVASHKEEFSQVLPIGKVKVYSKDILKRTVTEQLRLEKESDVYGHDEVADNI